MPGFNLVRNSKVYFTTNVNAATGVVANGALTTLGATGLGTQVSVSVKILIHKLLLLVRQEIRLLVDSVLLIPHYSQ
jgi:hypothetical protein